MHCYLYYSHCPEHPKCLGQSVLSIPSNLSVRDRCYLFEVQVTNEEKITMHCYLYYSHCPECLGHCPEHPECFGQSILSIPRSRVSLSRASLALGTDVTCLKSKLQMKKKLQCIAIYIILTVPSAWDTVPSIPSPWDSLSRVLETVYPEHSGNSVQVEVTNEEKITMHCYLYYSHCPERLGHSVSSIPSILSTRDSLSRASQASRVSWALKTVCPKHPECSGQSVLSILSVPNVPSVPSVPSIPSAWDSVPSTNFCFLLPTTSQCKKFKQLLLHKIVVRCPHHLQLESPPHILFPCISNQERKSLNSESFQALARVQIFVFCSPPPFSAKSSNTFDYSK